jgi:hypothetical protein
MSGLSRCNFFFEFIVTSLDWMPNRRMRCWWLEGVIHGSLIQSLAGGLGVSLEPSGSPTTRS